MTIATWLTASRWTYNLTAEILQSGIPAVWKHSASMVMPEVKALHPEWDSVPYQVKRTAVRDACRAMSNVKTFNLELKFHQAQGNRADETFAQLSYRSRQNPKQSCYIPDDAVTEHGVYHTILGPLRMAEAVPAEHKECRLVQERGLCPASTIFAGWRQSVLPVHLLGLDALLGSVGPVAGDVKLQDDGVVHDPVNRRGGGHGVGKDALPLREDQV